MKSRVITDVQFHGRRVSPVQHMQMQRFRGIQMSKQAFVYVVRLIRPEIVDSMSPLEEEVVEEHFSYLKRKLDEGSLILAGPCLDGFFGIVIFEAVSPEEAQQFMNNDPAIRKGLMTGEIHPFRVSLMKSSYKD